MNKSPGRLTFSDVTLDRGATQNHDLFDWFQDVAITSSGLGLTDVNYKRNLDIVQQDRDGLTLRRWSIFRAWPIKFVAGEWDNESDENVIESVTLIFDFFELIQQHHTCCFAALHSSNVRVSLAINKRALAKQKRTAHGGYV